MTRSEEIKQATPKEKFNNFHKQVAYEFGFEQGAQWADRTMLEKACEWLLRNANDYIINDKRDDGRDWLKIKSEMLDDFKKAMED